MKIINTKTSDYVVDASFVGNFFLPDGKSTEVLLYFQKFQNAQVRFFAPELLHSEFINLLRSAVLSKRISVTEAESFYNLFANFHIYIEKLSYLEVLQVGSEKKISCYDASYVWLAQSLGIPLLTLDEKLQKLIV